MSVEAHNATNQTDHGWETTSLPLNRSARRWIHSKLGNKLARLRDQQGTVNMRNYSLTGNESQHAIESGLADAEWYRPSISPEKIQELMVRTNGRATRDVALWLGLVVGSGALAARSRGTGWALPAFLAYGGLYGGSADPRWHEFGHGTAFKARTANDVFYALASFMLLREPTLWRWSHVRHHSDTLIVGRDREISYPRPPRVWAILWKQVNIPDGLKMAWGILRHAAGAIDNETRAFVPENELERVIWEARAFVAVLAGVVGSSIAAETIAPLLFIGLPTFYGMWLLWFFATTQHAGLPEDVLDHRLNTRTVYMNPMFRFLYLNMNYHLEHHLFPSVPYYALPALHDEIKDYLPAPKKSVPAAYREIFQALRMQRRDPTWELPNRATPVLVAGTALGGEVTLASGERTVPLSAEGGHVELLQPGKADLGPADSLRVGGVMRVDIEGCTYVLCRPTEESYLLADGLCTHGETHLAGGLLDGYIIECPKHNGRFDIRTGEAVRRPARCPLTTYSVDIVGGRIRADLQDIGSEKR